MLGWLFIARSGICGGMQLYNISSIVGHIMLTRSARCSISFAVAASDRR